MGFFAGNAVVDLNLSVSVKSTDAALLHAQQIVAQGKEANTPLAARNNARIALERALENDMKMLFEDPALLSTLLASSGAPSLRDKPARPGRQRAIS